MFEITRERVFAASHQLRGYEGKCERLHGHNWKVRVCIRSRELDHHGMVIDFHELDNLMAAAIEPFDHRHLNEVPPFDELNPSSENIAKVIGSLVEERLDDARLEMRCCEVWENDLCMARYSPDR